MTNKRDGTLACVALPALPALPALHSPHAPCVCVLERTSILGGTCALVVPTSISPPRLPLSRRQGHFPILNAAAQPGRSQGKLCRRPRRVGRQPLVDVEWSNGRVPQSRCAENGLAGLADSLAGFGFPASSVSAVSLVQTHGGRTCSDGDGRSGFPPFYFMYKY